MSRRDGDVTRCTFVVESKHRSCNRHRVAGTPFCGLHAPATSEQDRLARAPSATLFTPSPHGGRIQVPCPLDPTHTVRASALKSHIPRCKAAMRRRAAALAAKVRPSVAAAVTPASAPGRRRSPRLSHRSATWA